MTTQICVVTHRNICFSSLLLDCLQGFMCLLDHLGHALPLDLVKSVGWSLGSEACGQYPDLTLVEPYLCRSTLPSIQSLEPIPTPTISHPVCYVLATQWFNNLYGHSFINMCMLHLLLFLSLLCFLLSFSQLLFFPELLLQLPQLLLCFLHLMLLSFPICDPFVTLSLLSPNFQSRFQHKWIFFELVDFLCFCVANNLLLAFIMCRSATLCYCWWCFSLRCYCLLLY